MYYEILMKNLNQILTKRGISKMELAERADISVSFFSDLTNGKANPSLKIMEKLAASLNVSLPSLLSDHPVGAPNQSQRASLRSQLYCRKSKRSK